MRFCPWYPLASAGEHAPGEPGILQLRLGSGLCEYPRGKSAMVHYAHAPDVRAAALALGALHPGPDLVCRHLIEIEEATDLGTFHAKLRDEFVRRFGTPPTFPPKKS
ncbi:MAG: hypothetical protein IPQ07_28795 [Myxococcales bacterium]|nr:hypothetical protein [Myxococcales bacterium]